MHRFNQALNPKFEIIKILKIYQKNHNTIKKQSQYLKILEKTYS